MRARVLRNVGHKHLLLDDVLSARAGRLQALVHDGDGDIELIDDIGGDATALRLADDAGDPNVGPGTRHVAVMADRRSDVRNDDALIVGMAYLELNLVGAQTKHTCPCPTSTR